MNRVATLPHQTDDEAEQRIEFLSFLAENITTLHNSVEQCGIELSRTIYVSLLRRHLQPLRIPFEGEPLEGLQVMGILETRNLDFERVIILSMNDDNFPGSRTTQNSYIPYNLRAAYELPTPEHHDGVFAYYFYRLIERTKSLHMLYCSRADDKSTGEQSRYITQLDFESPFNLTRLDVGVDVNLFESAPITIPKVGRVAEQLREFARGEKRLSPTALFKFIECPLRFYYSSLARLRVEDELSEEVDAPMFGNILHHAMETLYSDLKGVSNLDVALAAISNKQIEQAVEQAIGDDYLRLKEGEALELSGNLLIVREVVSNYIKDGVIRYDKANHNFMIEGVEQEVYHTLKLASGAMVSLYGLCDRIDSLQSLGAGGRELLRVVDYKSGTPHLEFAGVEPLFMGEARERQSNIFQTLLYSLMLHESRATHPDITPALYYVRVMNDANYRAYIKDCTNGKADVESYISLHEEFKGLLIETLENLFDERIPFVQCDDPKHTCEYCDYSAICRRGTE